MTEKIKVESLDIITRMIKDKPYYEIKYKEVGKSYYNIGYSSYNLENVLKWKEECFELVDEQLAECPDELKQYRAIGTVEECRAAVEKQKNDKELESHDEKHILKYCISLMWELVGEFEKWYKYVHGEDAIKELCENEKFCYRMSYFNIVQELFLFGTSHSGGTSTIAKCEQLCVDSSDEIEFSFGDDEE